MIRIGLIDTGVESRHPDLVGKIAANYEFSEGRIQRVAYGRDLHNHGTACAHILSRHAPCAEIHSVQVISTDSSDSPRKLIAGFQFAVEQGWDIININAGAGRPHRELEMIATEAEGNGQIVIAAKDNNPDEIGYPAAYPNVIAVDMDYFEDPFDYRYHPGAPVEIEASGIYIEAASATGGRQRFTGSSFAAPHVAAHAAQLKDMHPGLDTGLFRRFLEGVLA
jgi:subtilisin